jgi:phosphoglycerate dehydrogenase-like enzyme
MDSSPLLVSVPTPSLLEAFGQTTSEVQFLEWDMSQSAPTTHIDIVVPPYMGSAKLLEQLARVSTRLVQSQSVGYDGVLESLPPGHVFANAAGVHETSTAELALALILASQRGIPQFVRDAEQGRWRSEQHPSLADRTVLLVGFGGVGHAIENRLLPFETVVIRVARNARTDQRGPVHGFSDLAELLPGADIVVVAVPLSEATTHLIDDSFLSRMHDDALLVNVSRGLVADTRALVAHATRGRLRFALDVTDPEPLPDGHSLFALGNVLISPHVGGATSAMLPRMVRLLKLQIERMMHGDDPVNVVLRS